MTIQPEPDNDPVFYRMPPSNLEAEMGLLGAILTSEQAYEKVSEFLRAEHFAEKVHGRIYAACEKLIQFGQIANPITLKNFFDQDGALAEIGGSDYLVRLAGSIVSVVNAEHYGRVIHDLYLRRQLISFGENVVNTAYHHDLDVDATQQIEDAESRLFQLSEHGEDSNLLDLGKATRQAIESAQAAKRRGGGVSGVTTGFDDLNAKLGGLQRSDLVILAGRPSMGKTALATTMAFNAAKAAYEERDTGAGVLFFSLEMSAEQLANRILSEQSEVPSDNIRRGEVTDDKFPEFVRVANEMSRIPFFIDHTPALTVAALRTRARRLMRTSNIGMIVVDYIGLMQPPPGFGGDNRVVAVSEISRGLKAVAKELNIPVIALSQLSRATENRDDKRPQLSDLRESGAIEQDADVVMFLFREEYYLGRAEPSQRESETQEKFNERYARWQERLEASANIADVIIAKQRHGPIGTVPLHFEPRFTRFRNLAEHERIPERRE